MLRFLIFKFDFAVKHRPYFSNKNPGLHKKLFIEKKFAVDYVKNY